MFLEVGHEAVDGVGGGRGGGGGGGGGGEGRGRGGDGGKERSGGWSGWEEGATVGLVRGVLVRIEGEVVEKAVHVLRSELLVGRLPGAMVVEQARDAGGESLTTEYDRRCLSGQVGT
jgi:hypothetical protein